MRWNQVDTRLRRPRLSVPATTTTIMLDVIIALVPTLAMAVYFFGPRVLALTGVSILFCILFELGYRLLTRQNSNLRDLSACVTGLLLALCLPPGAPYWAPALGAFFSIVVVKQFYGGLGRNFMNPALAGRMLLCTFPMLMTTWPAPMTWLPLWGTVDAVTAATPMSYLQSGALPPLSTAQMLLGQHGGSIGEGASFALLLGGAYLLLRRVISLRIPLSFLGTVALLTVLFPRAEGRVAWMTAQLLGGGLLLGAIFMATDYVTSPTTPRGQLAYGIGCGVLTVLLRYFGSYPDGVGWAILTMNCCVWLLDRAGMPRRFGVPHLADTRRRLRALAANMAEIRLVLPRFRFVRPGGRVPGEAHLDQLRRTARSALVLACVCLGALVAVLGVHRLTELTIYQQTVQNQRELLAQVMPGAEMMTETPHRSPDAVSISAGYRENTLMGYCVEVQVPGFVGPITLVVGVDTDGRVTGVAVTGQKETVGMGSQALEQAYFNRFLGLSGTIRATGPNAVDTVSGATVTARAVTSGVNRALEVVANLDHSMEVDYADGEV